MMAPILAQEQAEFAQMIGLFTFHPPDRSAVQKMNRMRQKWFRRKSKIAKSAFQTAGVKKLGKTKKMNL